MEISKKQIELVTLKPSEGMYLTRKDRKDNEEVILSESVILGRTDSPDNWFEISHEEGERLRDEVSARLMAENEERMQQEMNNQIEEV